MKKLDLDAVIFGPEPESNSHTIHRALYWYGNKKTSEDSKSYTIEFAKQNQFPSETIKKLSCVPESSFKNLGFVCRLISRGFSLNKEEWISSRISELINATKIEESSPEETSKPDIQERIFNQGTYYINEIEEKIDNIIKHRNFTFNCYDWLVANSIKPIYVNQIIKHYVPLLLELTQSYKKQDNQLVEAYSHWSQNDLKNYLTFVTNLISDCDKFGKNTKTVRKTRKKKVVPADKKVAKLNFKKEDTEYKIVSINPVDIIAAQQLWVFNTKTRKLGVFYSNDESGFNIKGSTLENFNEITSISKTLRKPLDIIPTVIKSKKTDLKKIMLNINAKDSPLVGRINSDTILLKAIK